MERSKKSNLQFMPGSGRIQAMEHFGSKLKALRLAKGLKQDELADLIGYSRTTYVRAETGTRSASDELLKLLGDYYGIPASQLIKEREAYKLFEKNSLENLLASIRLHLPDAKKRQEVLEKYLKD